MKKYKVMFWFNGNDEDADRIVVVETEATVKKDIIKLALDKLDKYPRTYDVFVEETDESMEQYYVIELINTNQAHEEAWYHNRNGELYVTYLSKGKYVTCHKLGNSQSIGEIDDRFCRVVAKFEHLDTY